MKFVDLPTTSKANNRPAAKKPYDKPWKNAMARDRERQLREQERPTPKTVTKKALPGSKKIVHKPASHAIPKPPLRPAGPIETVKPQEKLEIPSNEFPGHKYVFVYERKINAKTPYLYYDCLGCRRLRSRIFFCPLPKTRTKN